MVISSAMGIDRDWAGEEPVVEVDNILVGDDATCMLVRNRECVDSNDNVFRIL